MAALGDDWVLDDAAERAAVVLGLLILLLEHLANIGVDLLPQHHLDVAVEAMLLTEGAGQRFGLPLLPTVDDDILGHLIGAEVDSDP